MNKKVIAIYLVLISTGIGAISAMSSRAESPERQLIGTWKEVSWRYEKTSEASAERVGADTAAQNKLVVHQCESWQFQENGFLKLFASGRHRFVKWKLKGRGHILEIIDNGEKEHYNIMKLTRDSLIINYDSDLELRGLARLAFEHKTSSL